MAQTAVRNAFDRLEPFTGRYSRPGNHDFWAAGHYTAEKSRASINISNLTNRRDFHGGKALPWSTSWRCGNRVMLIALDTNLETDSHFDSPTGESADFNYSLESLLNDPAGKDLRKILFFSPSTPLSGNDPFVELKTPAS